MKPYIIITIVLALIAGTYFLGYQAGKNKIQVKYLEKEKLVHDTTLIAEILYKQIPAKIDSVILKDTIYQNKPMKIAISDTVITKDSSQIAIKYYFPPINKFDVWTSIKSKRIYIPEIIEVEKPENFWSRFGTSIECGIGYGLINKKVDLFVGAGFHFKIN